MTTIDLTLTLTSPLHHGSGSAGNTSLLRTQDIVLPDGRQAAVPFVSGNSLRHQLRDALAWHTVATLAVEPGSLSKAAVDLLWSGGAITSTGSQVDLAMARRVEETYPALGLLGYAAQSDMTAGTLRVSNLHLVCAENAWRLPDRLAGHNHVSRPAGMFRGEEFGTRHDVASTPVDRLVQTAGEIVQPGTTQMIYDLQVLKPGSVLWGEISLTPAATEQHGRLLYAAMELLAGDCTIALAAKTAVGYGRATVDGVPYLEGALDEWTQHLTDNADDVLQLIKDLTK
ncbi:hypothetical protein [Phytoactinopolyspora limicola]|uniref:hypothetical protein n=1 Tax=Phytoactinopolyspora limicola TaxID=2715536 RepID=UPI0014086E34|nr:hypothetical protein [Phytoactinopolyspora limicola]